MRITTIMIFSVVVLFLSGCAYEPTIWEFFVLTINEDTEPVSNVLIELRRDGEIVDSRNTDNDGKTSLHSTRGHSEKYISLQEFRSFHTIYAIHPDFQEAVVNGDTRQNSSDGYIHIQLIPLNGE